VLTDVMLNLGLQTLTNNRLAFFNLTHRLLVTGAAVLVPRTAAVFELREDIPVDDEVIAACRQLHGSGYTLALDDFMPDSPAEALVKFAKFVKVDVLSTTAAERAAIAARLLPRGLRLVAEKVETQEQADEVRAAGYSLVQGYFFCRPVTITGTAIPAQRLAALHLLAALNQSDITIVELDNLIKRDVSLSYRVLRCINSAAVGVGREIRSIREALVFLGTAQIRQWASVWALAGVQQGGSPETLNISLLRARCCEIIGATLDDGDGGEEYFLLGLCSLLDGIFGRPMEVVIGQLPLAPSIRRALLGEQNTARAVLDAVIAYERGAWDEAGVAAARAGFAAKQLPGAYQNAALWSHELSKATADA
jgi:c-di-GMP-related signal transduction protein